MIELIATAESVEQAEKLLEVGIDTLYIGEETYGLRLPTSFSRLEQENIVKQAHTAGKKVTVAINGIMHPDKMKNISEYLEFLQNIQVDQLTVGDPGVIFIMQRDEIKIPYIYDGATLVTNARQINFWGKRGAIGAVLAREVPYKELVAISPKLTIPVEILVYGATCIHHSKRPLLQNYYNFTKINELKDKERELFISEPRKENTHYSIYEDSNGTHIFSNNDINLMGRLDQLISYNYTHWKLDGIYTPGENFVSIASLFVQAREKIINKNWTQLEAQLAVEQINQLHPNNRGLDLGFFDIDPGEIK
ncbi:peptidase U32 family protein [Melissococcus plutonius]|uniref:Peptidase, U32 family small subunit [C1] n=1 Tax=Melissococcus plutonius TaxID=33970 RepID=A0A2Z5Y481_9ENTE|nr:peptidase U32 family protein [Melissococcus plutonius]BAL62792.1 peptidase, U32 family small subunit [Melissococcus plutonius DAT561]MCV2499460.1 U32 family peptidase [Melissococcus plutonius]MCV2501220.1 U32 family peptidase [Melissococcus plutonius]MCV2505698.1 U32 family peptidase [Melissococcus plutonius]MCV2508055.1 U32 family peptidase [Melissococcus plutonius]